MFLKKTDIKKTSVYIVEYNRTEICNLLVRCYYIIWIIILFL